ncbi:MAG TPA: hypothetical protein VN030_01025 [Cellvibrio sp.]|nr:hypothetical protein [Cellvibrio sp.]
MNSLEPLDQLLAKLQAPAASLPQLSFCDGSRDGAIKWIHSLPLTQIQFVGGLLYKALPEISRLQTSVANRINLLEALRGPSSQIMEGLAKGFLNQPLILPEEAVKTATIAQALQKHLNTGYVVAIRDLCKESSPKKHLLGLCLHRAIVGMGLQLLRYYQLYLPVPAKLWSDLHSLYQLASRFAVLEEPIAETLLHHQGCNTIKLAYTRVLLLASCRPNQLRQIEIGATYEALNKLTQWAQLSPHTGGRDHELHVALDSSQGPNSLSRLQDSDCQLLLAIQTANVIKQLQAMDDKPDEPDTASAQTASFALTHALTQHLIQAWGPLSQRNLDRQATAGMLDITVGISSIHYHLTGGTDFSDFLGNEQSQPVMRGIGSLFQNRVNPAKEPGKPQKPAAEIDPLDELDLPPEEETKPAQNELYPIYKIPLIDTSPGGYCIEWRDAIPNQVKTGELLGLLDPVRNYWSLGVVRWANLSQGATQLGIQILAPQATPVAVALLQNGGGYSEFLRALEIPAISALNQPKTLITNTVSFRERSKALIFHGYRGEEETSGNENIQLLERCFATGAFNQFIYQTLAPTTPQAAEKPTQFDPEWDA